jgi:glycosyltransferase involved in cell wall biosynthesis
MDRRMPTRVTYWTGVWQPGREALSNEVRALRHLQTPVAPVVSFSTGQRSAVSPGDRVVRLSSGRWLTLRLLAAVLERRGAVTHVFGALDEWHLLRAVGRKPVLFTVALPGRAIDRALARRVSWFAAETETLADTLVRNGVPRNRVSVVYPGVDLTEYAPGPAAASARFRILFASSPADPREFAERGIPFLVELARRRRDVEIVLLWRRWGNTAAARRALAGLSLPDNVTIEERDGRPMADVYRSVHATACCYEAGFGKSAPNSVIESVACGRPVLVSDTCGLATVVSGARAGVAFPRTLEAAAAAIDELRRGYGRYAINARALAVQRFDLDSFLSAYRALYARLARSHSSEVGMKPILLRTGTGPPSPDG